jgi:hypothetical protein
MSRPSKLRERSKLLASVTVRSSENSHVAPSVGAVVASSDGVDNFKMGRLFTMEEVTSIRQKRVQLQSSYKPPGQ